MKLFQQMLVAGASLSLIAPIAAQASDVVNLEEMNSYARSSKKKSSRLTVKHSLTKLVKILQILKVVLMALRLNKMNLKLVVSQIQQLWMVKLFLL